MSFIIIPFFLLSLALLVRFRHGGLLRTWLLILPVVFSALVIGWKWHAFVLSFRRASDEASLQRRLIAVFKLLDDASLSDDRNAVHVIIGEMDAHKLWIMRPPSEVDFNAWLLRLRKASGIWPQSITNACPCRNGKSDQNQRGEGADLLFVLPSDSAGAETNGSFVLEHAAAWPYA